MLIVTEKIVLECMGSIPDASTLTQEQAKDYMRTLMRRLVEIAVVGFGEICDGCGDGGAERSRTRRILTQARSLWRTARKANLADATKRPD